MIISGLDWSQVVLFDRLLNLVSVLVVNRSLKKLWDKVVRSQPPEWGANTFSSSFETITCEIQGPSDEERLLTLTFTVEFYGVYKGCDGQNQGNKQDLTESFGHIFIK